MGKSLTQKVILQMSRNLVTRMDAISGGNRSAFIRAAVEEKIAKHEAQELGAELCEGYVAMDQLRRKEHPDFHQ